MEATKKVTMDGFTFSTLSDFYTYLDDNKISYRIRKIDDHSFMLKKDLRPHRVNLDLKSNKNFKQTDDLNEIMEFIEKNKDKIIITHLEYF